MDSTNPLPATPPSLPEELPPIVTSPILDAGGDAFFRDLPELLKTHPGWWVAYYGNERIAMARTHQEIYRLCEGRDIDWSVLLIGCIESEPECDFIGMQPVWNPE